MYNKHNKQLCKIIHPISSSVQPRQGSEIGDRTGSISLDTCKVESNARLVIVSTRDLYWKPNTARSVDRYVPYYNL